MAASSSVAVTYVPADCGSVLPGKSKAPKAFRDVGIIKKLKDAGIRSVSEHHALDEPAVWRASEMNSHGVRNEEANLAVCHKVQRSLAKSLNSSSTSKPPFQFILGGECGMLPAIQTAFWEHASAQSPPLRVGLIYIDADTDLAIPSSPGSTGTFASMNMTHLLQAPGSLDVMKPFSRPSGEAVCDASNTVFFGTNMSFAGNKKEHFAYLFDNNFKVVSAESVAQRPEERAMETLKYLEERVDVIMVHLDIDAIDPMMFPLMNVPNYTGVTFEQMMRALSLLMGSEKVGGLTIAEVNPDHDPGLEMTERLTSEVVRMLGARQGNEA